MLQDYRLKQLGMVNKDKPVLQYKPGDVVYVISCQTSLCKTSSRKFRFVYIDPLVAYKILDKFQYIFIDIEGKKLNGVFH